MAITESLPVGNEVAAGATSKMGGTADKGAFAQTFAAAGKAAAGPVRSSKGAVTAMNTKVQQDLAGWSSLRGLAAREEGAGGQIAGLEETENGSGAVSSLIGKQEIVEDATGPVSAGILDLGVSGTGVREAVWSGVAAQTVEKDPRAIGGVPGETTALPTGGFDGEAGVGVKTLSPGFLSRAGMVAAAPVGVEGGVGAVRAGDTGGHGLVHGPVVATLGGDKAADLGGRSVGTVGSKLVSGRQVASLGAGADLGRDAEAAEEVDGHVVVPVAETHSTEEAVPAASAKPEGTSSQQQVVGKVAVRQAAVSQAEVSQAAVSQAEVSQAEVSQAGIGQVVSQVAIGRDAVGQARSGQDGAKGIGDGERVAVPVARVNGQHGEKTGVGAPSRKEKGVDGKGVAPVTLATTAIDGNGSLPLVGGLGDQVAGSVKGSDAIAVSGAPGPVGTAAAAPAESTVTRSTQVEAGAVAAQSPTAAAASEGREIAAQSAGAAVGGQLGVDRVASATVKAGVGTQVRGRAGVPSVAKAVTGKDENGSTRGTTQETGAAMVAASVVVGGVGDGLSVPGVAAAPVPVSSTAAETAVGGVANVGVGNAAAVQAGVKPQSGISAAGKDKDRKAGTDGARRGNAGADGARGAGDDAAAGGLVAATGVAAGSVGKAPAEQPKHQDAVATVSAATGVNASGAVSTNVHHGGAAGWSGPVAMASPTAVPVRAEVLSGTAGASGRSAAAAEDGGFGAGFSSGLAGSGQGHTTLQATPTVLEVGIPGGSHGWLKVRAEMGEGGAVQASVSSATQAGQDALRRELPAMSAYLQSEHVPVTLQMAHGAANAVAGSTANGLTGGEGSTGSGFGSGGGQAGANAEQGRSDAAGFAGFSSGGSDAGSRQQGSEAGGVANAVSGLRTAADEVSAAVASAERDWSTPSGYGGVSSGGGGSWVNVIA